MRHITKLLLLLVFTISCKAQQPIYDNFNFGDEVGVYYKDLDNDFNRFEGTWLYTNGTTSLEVQFVKHTHMHIQDLGDNYYTDAIVGEYKYIENGIPIVNTLSNLQENHINPYDYNITGTRIKKHGDVNCDGCDPNEVQIISSFSDPEIDIEGSDHAPIFNMRHFIDNGTEKLDVYFTGGKTRLPYGEYILIKQ